MKAVILAGGYGTRLTEETILRPKPMVEIGGKPILWHILKIFSAHGINDFIICCGYKSYVIKEYFANYFLHSSDVTFDMTSNKMEIHQNKAEPWKVTLIDTGESTATGGRLKKAFEYIGDDDFCFTYGDGLADINISQLIHHHNEKKLLATVTAVRPPGRFGSLDLDLDNDTVNQFVEKPVGDGNWINAGFFVLSSEVIKYIKDETTSWELEPMRMLASAKKLTAYRHDGFWHAMDTIRDRDKLNMLWDTGEAPWKMW